MSNRAIVLKVYRQLHRAIVEAFKDDTRMIEKAREEARSHFVKNRALKDGSVEAQQAVGHGLAVAQILRENVVQGQRSLHGPDTYKLKIRPTTEKGDNSSIKKAAREPKGEPFKGSIRKFES